MDQHGRNRKQFARIRKDWAHDKDKPHIAQALSSLDRKDVPAAVKNQNRKLHDFCQQTFFGGNRK